MAHERRAHILRLLAERGRIRSAELAAELGVTDETIRTDLVLLEREGQLRRRHGGAEFLPCPHGVAAAASSGAARLDYQLAAALLPRIDEGTRLMVDASRLALTLLALLCQRRLTLITHSPALLQQFAAKSLPHELLCIGGWVEKGSGRLIPTAGAVAATGAEVAVLSPERVELREGEVAIDYHHEADRRWAQEALAHAGAVLLAFPASAMAPWSGKALPCSPALVVTEDHLPEGAKPAPVQLLPWLDPDSLLQRDSFDY